MSTPRLQSDTRYMAWQSGRMVDLSPAPRQHWHITVVRGNTIEQTNHPVPALAVAGYLAHLGVDEGDASFIGRPARPDAQPPFSRSDEPRDERAVYFIEGAGLIKIGVAHHAATRVASLQVGSPIPLRLVAVLPGGGRQGERELHRRFASRRRHGEWYEPTPELLGLIRGLREGLPS